MKNKKIKGQILNGYLLLVLIPIVMTIVSVLYLLSITKDLGIINNNRNNADATKEAVVGHYTWIMGLGDALRYNETFSGSLDPATCGLGKWMQSVSAEDLQDASIAAAMKALEVPHSEIHTRASALIQIGKTDPQGAQSVFRNDIEPKVEGIISNITIITEKYKSFANEGTLALEKKVRKLMETCVILIVFAIVFSIYIGNTIAKKISKPIQTVAKWAQDMAIGCETVDFSEVDLSKMSTENEVAIMVNSFQAMASSVKSNSAVVKRVADGDLTAFVEIRSAEDTLGQSLYRMVQSNDHMFADILHVAGNVASSANEIAKASQYLAASSTEQAASVEDLTATVSRVNELTIGNTHKVSDVQDIVKSIRVDMQHSSGKMLDLVTAVEDIRGASDRISTVIKTIDDIAFQTNILALNAAVEAARAGAAGKGFAVVADEVRNLAAKSATAAEETKDLIGNTIQTTHKGVQFAKETNETFGKIAQRINQTVEVMEGIANASEEQERFISSIHSSIGQVSDIAASNAASCEESFAASEEMRRSAQILSGQMGHFNLRQREYGHPYIPVEKKNDAAFVAEAEENYKKFLERGRINEEKLMLR